MFEENNPKGPAARRFYSLYDAVTGERLVDYVPPPGTAGTFACYTANGLTFLGAGQDRHMILQHARTR